MEPLPPLENAGKTNRMMFIVKFRQNPAIGEVSKR